MRRVTLGIALTLASLFVAVSGAQAVVVDVGAAGRFGVALVPGSSRAGLTTVSSAAPCSDPWLSSDLGGPVLPNNGLCWHGGGVIHNDETFDLAWDPLRRDWATTRDYVEQFLRDVANGTGTLTSPYALTTQYRDPIGRAGNASAYGGGCIDYGQVGGSSCQFGNTDGTGPGNPYPTSDCPVTGVNQFHEEVDGGFDSVPNDICLTDAKLKSELATMIAQEGLIGHIQRDVPLLVLMTPPGVELDAAGTVCSANGTVRPPVPTLAVASTGGTVLAGTYKVMVTYVTGAGDSLASASQTVTTSGSTSTITIGSPPPLSGATGCTRT